MNPSKRPEAIAAQRPRPRLLAHGHLSRLVAMHARNAIATPAPGALVFPSLAD
jgi:hypothetical protein